MRKIIYLWSCLLLCANSLIPVWANDNWPEWEQFKHNYISEDGRVIDPANGYHITTSEGQSYGLFFALVNNDKKTFDRLFQWTETQLANGDLTGFLPAWKWGKKNDGNYGILDKNSAADSDLWIAYSLLEAGRLWNHHSYQAIGTMLLRRIAREEVARLPGVGPVLLPAPLGFVKGKRWTINPSYLPPQLLARFATMQGPWQEMYNLLPDLLIASAPHGFIPDWIDWSIESGWQQNEGKKGIGSYDAIRVYLWIGMLSKDDPSRKRMIKHLSPMLRALTEQGIPERVDTITGKVLSWKNIDFVAPLLPMAKDFSVTAQLPNKAKIQSNNYYASVLDLFGYGWIQERFRFAADGTLLLRWSDK